VAIDMNTLSKSALASLDARQGSALAPKQNEARRKLLLELFETQARLNPGTPAIGTVEGRLSYGNLDAQANRIAAELTSRGIGRESVVSIVLPKSAELIAAMLGVWKAGAAFSPLEPSWPDVRLKGLIQGAASRCLLTSSRIRERLSNMGLETVFVDEHRPGLQKLHYNQPAHAGESNLAYVLFTSGSTGEPKPVGVEHRSIGNYVHSILGILQAGPGDTFALLTSVSADLGYSVLFPSLCSGGCLELIAAEAARTPELLREWFRNQPPDYLKITPSYAAALLESDSAGQLLPRKCLLLGGEVLRWPLVRKIWQLCPHLRIANHYGPTETTVGVLVHELRSNAGAQTASVPLGKPLGNCSIHVYDSEMRPVGEGSETVGELYIGGECVTRGYLGRPGLTASRFLPDGSGSSVGGRLYRTGDLVRTSSDGALEFLNRIDDQLKVRGYRVEPVEIESVLYAHPDIRSVAVVPRHSGDQVTLIACVATRRPCEPEQLREWLNSRLPDHMIPDRIVCLDAMPLLPSGKIDRQAVGKVASSLLETPSTATFGVTEERIARIWRHVLNVDSVGATQKFFEIGGTSLRVIQLIAEFKREFGQMLPLGDFFAHPTIRDLASYLTARGVDSSGDTGAAIAESRRTVLNALRDRRTGGEESSS
jgi:amino acid adenylation domain-containing protein